MSTIFGKNIHHTVAPWSYTAGTGVEQTRFQGFDVNSWAKDCFTDKFTLSYKDKSGNDKKREVDNKGVIHFTKDGCIILNGTMYTGGQCLNTVYEAYTGNSLNTCGDAEKFMLTHADDPHFAVVYFHIYNDSSIVGDSASTSGSTGTGLFITHGSTQSGRLFYQHYWWNGTHYYRVIANNCSRSSGWISPKDIHSIDYDNKTHKIMLRGINNLATALVNESAFTGKSVSEAMIPVVDSTTDGLMTYNLYNYIYNTIDTNIADNAAKITYLNTSVIPDLVEKVNRPTVTPAPVTAAPVDLTPYVTKSELKTLGYIKSSDVANNYETKTAHNTDINNIKKNFSSYITYTNANSYYLSKSVFNSSIANYVSKIDLVNQSYIKTADAKKSFPSYQYITNQSYVTKTQLTSQAYVTKTQLIQCSYIKTGSVYSMLEYKASKSSVDNMSNKVSINSDSISELYTSYNTLYNSFNSLKNSYNNLYNAVAYNISYHDTMIKYLIGLHTGHTSTPVSPTKAPVTSAPATSVPITYIKINISNVNSDNILWNTTYIKEAVAFKLNDSDSIIGSTYGSGYIQLNNINFNSSAGYLFNLTLVSSLIPLKQLSETDTFNSIHGYKLIWTGDTWTTQGRGPSEYNPSTNIKEWPYILEGACSSKLSAYTYSGNSYYIWSNYQAGSSTSPATGSAYYTAKFRYVYPYIAGLHNAPGSGEYPNAFVINDDSSKKSSDVMAENKVYTLYNGVTCSLTDSWVQNNKYYVRYLFGIKRSAAEQFNKGTYVLKCGLNTCSPQTFRTDGLTIK